MMKTCTRWMVIGMLAIFAMVSVRAPGFAGWFSEDESESDTDKEKQEELYDAGTEALEGGDWEEAVELFEEVAELKGLRADGALYWKAYALGKLRRLPQALSTLETLGSTYPKSRWKDDAKALAIELRQAGGKSVSPEEDDTEELKLVALNGLMQMDPDRAVPMLERFLAGGSSRKLKEQALFVLVQTGTPRAREIVEKSARGQINPALQRKAVELLGMFGGDDSFRLLKDIYATTQDDQVKRQVLQAYMVSGESEALLAVARTERSEELRREAIQYLGASGAEDELSQMYAAETSKELRGEILQALAVSGSEHLLDLARREKDPELRRRAVQNLGIMDSDSTSPVLLEIYASEKDLDVRRAVLDAFMIQGNATAIITIARREKDPVMRRAAVEKLSVMGSKEASDYLMSLLEE